MLYLFSQPSMGCPICILPFIYNFIEWQTHVLKQFSSMWFYGIQFIQMGGESNTNSYKYSILWILWNMFQNCSAWFHSHADKSILLLLNIWERTCLNQDILWNFLKLEGKYWRTNTAWETPNMCETLFTSLLHSLFV